MNETVEIDRDNFVATKCVATEDVNEKKLAQHERWRVNEEGQSKIDEGRWRQQ